ncbi:MAG: hypothetical protein K2Y27_31435 [Xanthobacteraceae bacterium]|nr:hypothetical protein [Xanthobacteraceae bacterium]
MKRILPLNRWWEFAEPNESNLCSIGSAVATSVTQRTRACQRRETTAVPKIGSGEFACISREHELKKVHGVIPGRAEGASPESSLKGTFS